VTGTSLGRPQETGLAAGLPGTLQPRWIVSAETLRACLLHSIISLGVFLVLYHTIDRSVAEWCRSLAPGLRRPFEVAGQLGNSLPYLVCLPFLWVFFRLKRMHLGAQACWFMFAMICASGVWVNMLKPLAGRLRPMWLHREGRFGFEPLTMDPMKMSFPSGHAAVAVALALGTGLFFPRLRVPLYVLAFLVCAARVLSGAHYPSDVVLGAWFAFFITTSCHRELAAQGVIERVARCNSR
jgi:membrane-associated phospholipid phosphatase